MTRWLTYKQAAARVRRSVRTIKRWRRHGMPMHLDERGRRIVDEEKLLAWWRGRLAADPVHQARMRRRVAEEAASRAADSSAATSSPERTPAMATKYDVLATLIKRDAESHGEDRLGYHHTLVAIVDTIATSHGSEEQLAEAIYNIIADSFATETAGGPED